MNQQERQQSGIQAYGNPHDRQKNNLSTQGDPSPTGDRPAVEGQKAVKNWRQERAPKSVTPFLLKKT